MKKLSLGFVAVFMFLAIFSVTCFAEGSAPKREGNVYHIKTVENLVWVAEQTQGGNDFNGCEVMLDNHICSDYTFTTAIGTSTTPFNGCFNGNGKALNFKMVCTADGAIFGCVGNQGEIRNLKVGYMERKWRDQKGETRTSLVAVGADRSIKGIRGSAAGLAYQNDGVIDTCRVGADIASYNRDAAGMVVNNNGRILNCTVESRVDASNSKGNAAGLAVNNTGDIVHCCMDGKVVSSKPGHSAGIAFHNTLSGFVSDCQVSRKCCRNADSDYVYKNEGTLADCGKFFFNPW